jgi:AraC-like DNA-binding protein
VYRTDDAPAGQRTRYWEQVVADTTLPLVGRHHAGDFQARLVTGRLGHLTVTEATTPAGECVRTPRLIRRSSRDLYQIDVMTSGHVRVEHGGRRARLGPGDLALIDPTHPVRYVSSATTHVCVLFPRAMLPLAPDDVVRLAGRRLAGDRGTGALVSTLARQLPRHLDDWHSSEAVHLGIAVVDLLRVALTARLSPAATPAEVRRQELLARVYAFIDDHLADPDLAPARIAAAHHISLRHLHKLFAAEQATVAGWVRRRRLERCRRDLLDPGLRHRPVSAIAARWGLTDPAHFSRAFRAAYGLPPVEYRGTAGGPATVR